jgi:hypothetical protein
MAESDQVEKLRLCTNAGSISAPTYPGGYKNLSRSSRLVYCCQVFLIKILAENYHVREWAPAQIVGAHDNFSAGY